MSKLRRNNRKLPTKFAMHVEMEFNNCLKPSPRSRSSYHHKAW